MCDKTGSGTISVLPGRVWPLGAAILAGGKINFAAAADSANECGVLIFRENEPVLRVPFSVRKGKIGCVLIDGLIGDRFEYLFYSGEEEICDPYAVRITGAEHWCEAAGTGIRHAVIQEEYDWEDDGSPDVPLEEKILYLIHPRGYTRQESSGVEAKGTFQGIIEKIPYMKELGITVLELMPSYDFSELEEDGRINFWGYKPGFYFAPKAAYSQSSRSDIEFKNLVKALHREGMELVMQFYFPEGINAGFILEVLRYWAVEYHVDGFHLPGNWIPVQFIKEDPVLSGCQLLFEENYNNGYLEAARRFLRGEEWSLFPFLDRQRRNRAVETDINYITNYSGFSLADLVSYDDKHNEKNGEENRDGENNNISWNCGCEGETNDENILELRMRQMKNAFVYLLTAQGIPMIVGGDEFGFGREGNNNPYCQDNEISWIDWNLAMKNASLYEFVKRMIAFRKQVPVLPMQTGGGSSDYVRPGYPGVSWHGKEAWWLEPDGQCRQAGIMYCSRMSECYVYVAYNADCAKQQIALPRLPEGLCWKILEDTDAKQNGITEGKTITAEAHSVIILVGIKKEGDNG